MNSEKPNLLDLFVICNVPSKTKFQLFCRNLMWEDVELQNYFDEELAGKYSIPAEYEMEGFYNKAGLNSRWIEDSTFFDGFSFGVFNSYDEALNAAKSYSSKELLDEFFRIYNAAKDETEKEDLERERVNALYSKP